MTYLTDWSLSTPTESQSHSQSQSQSQSQSLSRTLHTSHFPTTVTSTSTSMLQAPSSSTPTPQQHKTNFCYAYQNGSCQRGDSCKYRHESPHMTSASPSPSHTRGASVPILQHHSTDHNGYSHFPNTTSTNTNTNINTNTNTSISASFELRNNNGYNMHQDRKLVMPQQQRDTYSDPVPRTTTPPVHVQQHNNGGVMLNVPHGACRQWYMRGRCDYGTNCKYQHIHNTGNNHTNNNNNNNNGHQQQQQHQQHQQHHTSHHHTHTNSYTNGEMNGLLDSTQSKPLYNRASSLDLNGNSYHHNNNNNQYHTQHNNNNNNGNGNGLLQNNGQQQQQQHQQQQHNVCHYYARTGKCKYGGSCKFSHDSHHQQHQQHQQHQPQQHNMHSNNNTSNNSPIFSTHPAPQQHNNHTFGLNGHSMNGYAQPFQSQQTSHHHSHSMSALNGHGHQPHHQQHQLHHPSSSHDFLSMPSINKFPSVDMPDTTITTGHTNPLSTLSLNPNPDVFPSAPSSFLRLHSNVPMMDANERDMNDEYIPLQTPAQSSLSSVFGAFTSQQNNKNNNNNNNNNAFASPFPSSLSLSLKPSVPLFGSSSTSSSSLLSTPSSALSLSSSSSAASSTASSPVHSHYRADLRCDKCSNLGTVYNKTVPSTNQPISGWYTPSTTMISLCWRCCSCLHCGNAKPISSLGLCAVCNPLQA